MAKRPPTRTSQPTLLEAAVKRGDVEGGGAPLADRMRPRSLEELVGQAHLIGPGRLLAHAIGSDHVPSMILWGPPGSGKTTLARVVSHTTRSIFVPFSAVLGGVPELREILAEARERRAYEGRATTLFVDEIHRFNKAQQDAFLPHVEDGTITLIGATTENPSFSVNAAILSRAKVFRLEALTEADVTVLLRRALTDVERGLGARHLEADDGAIAAIARAARGDARRALGLLETAAALLSEGRAVLDIDTVDRAAEERTLLYDKSGEEHYNVVSALIKSMRGSDPDAAIYWLMRMLDAGDDPSFVLRRLIIFASEDVGNADPRALTVATAADAAFHRLGMPEAHYAIAQACLYLATRTEIEFRRASLQRRSIFDRSSRRIAGPEEAPQRADRAHEGRGLRRGLSLRARLRRLRPRRDLPARRTRRAGAFTNQVERGTSSPFANGSHDGESGSSSFDDAEIRQIAILLRGVQAVAHDEHIVDREPEIVDVHGFHGACRLVQEATEPDAAGTPRRDLLEEIATRQTRVDDVFDDEDVLPLNRPGQIEGDAYDPARLRRVSVALNAEKLDRKRQVDRAHQVRQKYEAPLQHTEEHEWLSAVVLRDLGAELLHFACDLLCRKQDLLGRGVRHSRRDYQSNGVTRSPNVSPNARTATACRPCEFRRTRRRLYGAPSRQPRRASSGCRDADGRNDCERRRISLRSEGSRLERGGETWRYGCRDDPLSGNPPGAPPRTRRSDSFLLRARRRPSLGRDAPRKRAGSRRNCRSGRAPDRTRDTERTRGTTRRR